MNLFFAGLIAGVLSSIVFWVFEWRRLNKAASGEYRSLQIIRRKKVINYLIIGGFIGVIAFVTGFLLVKTEIGISGYYAFLSGFVLFVWTQYLEVIYWERKNRKTLIVDKTSFYTVDTGGSR
jgi:protein-S-isoprenylcysteine O-methyltransferase Ste14